MNLSSNGRVLIAEDDIEVGAVFALALRLEGYEVQVVRSVVEALECLSRKAVDLLILDWVLLDGTSEDVCTQARAIDPDIPIIVMSAVLNHQTRSTIKCHPVLFMTKPVRMDVLRNSVRFLLEKRRTKETTKGAVTDALTDTAMKQISREAARGVGMVKM